MDSDIETTIVGVSVTTQLLMDEVYGSKNTLSDFMDLSDKLQVYRPKNALLEFMDLYFQSLWTK